MPCAALVFWVEWLCGTVHLSSRECLAPGVLDNDGEDRGAWSLGISSTHRGRRGRKTSTAELIVTKPQLDKLSARIEALADAIANSNDSPDAVYAWKEGGESDEQAQE